MIKYKNLSYLSLLYLQRLEFTLSAFERIVFYRLFLIFGYKRFNRRQIKAIALKIDIHHLKLEEVMDVLVKKYTLVDVGQGYLRVNTKYLAQLNKQEKIKNRIKKLRNHPQKDFLLQLFKILFQIKISHKQKNSDQLLEIDFKQWLLLLNLVYISDQCGVVIGVGTHQLSNFTGLSRYALLRSMAHLFKLGMLRSKIDGTLNSNYLNFVSAVYFINLSHPVWKEHQIFGRYLIFSCPPQTPILRQLIEVLDGLDPKQPLGKLDITEFIPMDNQISKLKGSACLVQHEENLIQGILEIGMQWNTEFYQEFKLSSGYTKNKKKLSLNSNELNLKRLDYIFCYLASYYPHMDSVTPKPDSRLLPHHVKTMILKLFREVTISNQLELKIQTHYIKWSEENETHNQPKYPISEKKMVFNLLKHLRSEIIMAQNHLKQEILSLLVQYVYRSELSHVIDSVAEITDHKNYDRVVPIGCSNESLTHKIYFHPDRHLKRDVFFQVEYSEDKIQDPRVYELGGVKLYKRFIKEVDLDLKQQIELGVLHEQCLGLGKFE